MYNDKLWLWKRKRKLSGSAAAAFSEDKEEDEGIEDDEESGVDWLVAAKRRRAVLLEDSRAKSKRLQEEGSLLAENERYWEAIKYWDEAIELTPGSAPLHEMKSQVGDNLSCTMFLPLIPRQSKNNNAKQWSIYSQNQPNDCSYAHSYRTDKI